MEKVWLNEEKSFVGSTPELQLIFMVAVFPARPSSASDFFADLFTNEQFYYILILKNNIRKKIFNHTNINV